MQILVQPFSDKSFGEFIIEALNGNYGDFNAFQAAVAFAKRSGVQHIKASLKKFINNGNNVRIVVGVDLNGTTSEGLELLLDALGDAGELLVNHDENLYVTFHPKIYFFESEESAILTVGSGNLTAGGLYSNDEGFIILKLDKSDPEDHAIIVQYKESFEKWCDKDSELVKKIENKEDIQALIDAGYVPSEAFVPAEADEAAQGEVEPEVDDGSDEADTLAEDDLDGAEPDASKLFGRMKGRKRAPKIKVTPTIKPKTPPQLTSSQSQQQVAQLLPTSPVQPATTTTPAPVTTSSNLVFVMTLQRTDVGKGQTTAGATRRSPEVFIPLVARDEEPDFWGWDHLFVDDPTIAGKKDRNNVAMRLGGDIINVNMFYNDNKKDLRLRNEALRSSGDIDDILKIEKTDGSQGFDYYIEIIPKSAGDYPHYREACANKVKGVSKKYWGYYTT